MHGFMNCLVNSQMKPKREINQMAINTITTRAITPRDGFTKGEDVQNNSSAFNGSINSTPIPNLDGQKLAYAGVVTKLLPIIIRNAPSVWRFVVATGALAGSIIAKNWDSVATVSNDFVKIIAQQPDILRQYLASEFSKNVSPKDRAALDQILSQISQGGFEKAGTGNPIPLAPLQRSNNVMQANAVQGRSKAVQDRIDQINAALARLQNSGASNNTPQTQAKIAKLKAELKSLTQAPARAMSQTGSANVLQMSQGGRKGGTGDIDNKTDGSNGGGKKPEPEEKTVITTSDVNKHNSAAREHLYSGTMSKQARVLEKIYRFLNTKNIKFPTSTNVTQLERGQTISDVAENTLFRHPKVDGQPDPTLKLRSRDLQTQKPKEVDLSDFEALIGQIKQKSSTHKDAKASSDENIITQWVQRQGVTPLNSYKNFYQVKGAQTFENVPKNHYFKYSRSHTRSNSLRFKQELSDGSVKDIRVDAFDKTPSYSEGKTHKVNVGKPGSRVNNNWNR
jgi:hypothetical protein